jgi:hypothetical protein
MTATNNIHVLANVWKGPYFYETSIQHRNLQFGNCILFSG